MAAIADRIDGRINASLGRCLASPVTVNFYGDDSVPVEKSGESKIEEKLISDFLEASINDSLSIVKKTYAAMSRITILPWVKQTALLNAVTMGVRLSIVQFLASRVYDTHTLAVAANKAPGEPKTILTQRYARVAHQERAWKNAVLKSP